jgi:mRNA-degrading endonuclease toxin of MazEF toxin-antitoxin module
MKIRFGHLYAADMNPRVRSKPGKIRPVVVIQSSCDGTIPTAAQFVRVLDHEGRATGDEAARVGRVT